MITTSHKSLRCFLVLALLIFFIPAFAAAKTCLNGTCHQKLSKTKYLHGPIAAEQYAGNGCEMCHKPAGPSCTAEKAGKFSLKNGDLCITCHSAGTGTQHSTAKTACLKCHNPHGSQNSAHLLRDK